MTLEAAKYLCEFFFTDWAHYLLLACLLAATSSSVRINRS